MLLKFRIFANTFKNELAQSSYKYVFNSFMPTGISHLYKLEEFFFSILWLLGGIFHLYSNYNRTFCTAASDLCLHCLQISHKEDTRLIWDGTINHRISAKCELCAKVM